MDAQQKSNAARLRSNQWYEIREPGCAFFARTRGLGRAAKLLMEAKELGLHRAILVLRTAPGPLSQWPDVNKWYTQAVDLQAKGQV